MAVLGVRHGNGNNSASAACNFVTAASTASFTSGRDLQQNIPAGSLAAARHGLPQGHGVIRDSRLRGSRIQRIASGDLAQNSAASFTVLVSGRCDQATTRRRLPVRETLP